MSATHTGIVDGEPVLLKACDECGAELLATTDARSGFYFRVVVRKGRSSVAWTRFCKECLKARKRAAWAADPEESRRRRREAHRRLRADPERVAADRLRRNAWQVKKRRDDPDYAERERESHRRWREKKQREDPNYFSRENQERRRQARLAAEAKIAPRRQPRPRIELGPYRDWLEAFMAEEDLDREATAERLGLHPRRLFDMLEARQERVSLDTVDRTLLLVDRPVKVGARLVWTIDDLYPIEEAMTA